MDPWLGKAWHSAGVLARGSMSKRLHESDALQTRNRADFARGIQPKKPTKRGRFRPTRQISLSAQPTKKRMRIHWDSKLLAWATRHLPGSVPARPFFLCGQEDSDVAAMQCKHQFHRGCISRRLRTQKPAGFTSQMTWLVKTPRFKEMGIADL